MALASARNGYPGTRVPEVATRYPGTRSVPGYPAIFITRLQSTRQCSYGCEFGIIYNAYHEFYMQTASMIVRHILDYSVAYYLLSD